MFSITLVIIFILRLTIARNKNRTEFFFFCVLIIKFIWLYYDLSSNGELVFSEQEYI